MEKKKIFSFKPEFIFLIIASFFGIINLLITPYGSGSDEFTHLNRIFEISKFQFIPHPNINEINLPVAFSMISYRTGRTLITPLTLDSIKSLLKITIDPKEAYLVNTRSVYFPTLYFPAALVMGIFSRILNNFPVLITVFIIRFINYFIFILFAYLSIKIIPYGKWVLFALLLAPGVINMSAIVNVDYASYGMSALFISWVVNLSKKKDQINNREFIILLGLILGLFTLKPNYAILIFLLFIISKKLITTRKTILLIFFSLACFILFTIGWNIIVNSYSISTNSNIFPFDQLINVVTHPFQFFQTLFNAISSTSTEYFLGWIGYYGYGVGVVPPAVYPLFLLALLMLTLIKPENEKPALQQRIIFLVLGIMSTLSIFAIFYLFNSGVGSKSIFGVQGRYFFLSGLLIFIGLSGFDITKYSRIIKIVSTILISVTNGLFTFGLFATYYLFCGSNYYIPGLCYLPEYKSNDQNSYSTGILDSGFVLKQTFSSECNNVKEINFFLAPDSGTKGLLIVKIFNSESTNPLVSNSYIVKENDIGKKLTFTVPNVTNGKGEDFYFTIEGQSDSKNGFSFATTMGDDYPAGKFFINNDLIQKDLFFHYGCQLK